MWTFFDGFLAEKLVKIKWDEGENDPFLLLKMAKWDRIEKD
jgi:hypothetical protein